MRREVHLPRKYNILLIAFFTIVVCGATVFFIKKHFDHKAQTEALVETEVHGRIISMKDQQRGSYYIEIEIRNDTLRINSLPIAYEVKQYDLQVGDSVAKAAYGRKLFFYRMKEGKCRLLFEQNL